MTDFQQILEECLARISNGTATVDECLASYPEHANELRPLLRTVLFLNLGPGKNPATVSRVPTRTSLFTRFLHFRLPQLNLRPVPMVWRASLTFAIMLMALLATGTARAQAALPGEPFYGWKRASEEVWRAVSSDQVAIDIAISDRRLNEWIAVADDPTRRDIAKESYFEALNRLKSNENAETIARILPVLRSHHDRLNNNLDDAGYTAAQLRNLAAQVENLPIPVEVATQVTVADRPAPIDEPPARPAPTEVPPSVEPPSGPAPTDEVQPTAEPPTRPAPTETAPPTEPPPTETAPPTEPPPTEVTPQPTEPPTEPPTAPATEPAPTQPAPTQPAPNQPAPTDSTVPTDVIPVIDPLQVTPSVP